MGDLPPHLARLREAALDCDALVLASPEAVLHFTGFDANAYTREGSPPWSWSPAALVVSSNHALLVVAEPHLALAHERVSDVELKPYDPLVPRAFERAVTSSIWGGATTIGIEAQHVPAAIVSALASDDLRPIDAAVERLCAVKAEWEIDRIRVACAAATLGQRAVADAARVGVTELDLFQRARVEIETTLGGRVTLAGDLVSGQRAATDQGGAPGPRPLGAGDVLICDLAPAVNGFFGDSCSSVVVGGNEKAVRAARAACDALEAASEQLVQGRRGREVDAVARNALERHGLRCPHHMGHGLGLSQLEYPLIASNSNDILEPGHVVALEPGIYADGFGVRVEHVFLVTTGGPEQLTGHQLSLVA